MLLRTGDAAISFHFQVTSGGWALTAMARDKFYVPGESFTILDAMSRYLRSEGYEMFRPVFHIDYMSSGIVNTVWASDLEKPETSVPQFIRNHLTALDREFGLRLSTLMEPFLCQENFLIGFRTSRFSPSDLMPSTSTQVS